MKLSLWQTTAAALLVATAGCTSRMTAVPFNVIVRGPAESCSIEVHGHRVTTDELLALARLEARSGRRAHIKSDTTEAPYRCVAGTIYTLQMAGFENVALSAEPPPKTR